MSVQALSHMFTHTHTDTNIDVYTCNMHDDIWHAGLTALHYFTNKKTFLKTPTEYYTYIRHQQMKKWYTNIRGNAHLTRVEISV